MTPKFIDRDALCEVRKNAAINERRDFDNMERRVVGNKCK